MLLEHYQLRQEPGYGTPQQHEQNRSARRQKALAREEERLIDAYQAGVMELEALKERCGRIGDERARVAARLSQLAATTARTDSARLAGADARGILS